MTLFEAPAVVQAAGAALAAALTALDREGLIQAATKALYEHDVKSYPAAKWEAERPACRAAYRERGEAVVVALGLVSADGSGGGA